MTVFMTARKAPLLQTFMIITKKLLRSSAMDKVTFKEAIGRGAFAGGAATLPMTLAMKALFQALPEQQRYPLPPWQITKRLVRKSGLEGAVDRKQKNILALFAHYMFGAGIGAAYSLLFKSANKTAKPQSTIGYALLVWAVSYIGWLPATGLMPKPGKQRANRQSLMIMAHIVWGLAFSWIISKTFRKRSRAMN